MINVMLPNGEKQKFSAPASIQAIAESLAPKIAKKFVAAKLNDKLVDLSAIAEANSEVAFLTAQDQDGLEVIRHSTAHLLAHAVKILFPEAQVTIGPVIKDGFYYDFSFSRPFTPEDLKAIEEKMRELAAKNYPVIRKLMSRAEASAFFEKQGEHYKVEIINSIPSQEDLTFYQQDDFVDLCRGPHVPNTAHLKIFKLLKLAGAYWRGDSKNEMLQRIYGTAWATDAELKEYLHQLEEAEKRDHRRIAKQLDLFHIQEEAPGMVFWHPNGWTIYQIIENHIRTKLRRGGYQEIKTPQVVSRTLWEASGHWDKFRKEMFITESEERFFAIKPMSCPCHVQVFNQGLKSYRDLPLRLAEFGSCHRNEPSGSLHGLMRVRNFVQDDAHIFCTEEQIQEEVAKLLRLVFEVYAEFGFADLIIRLSTRPEERVGSDEVWNRAEHALEEALNEKGLKWEVCPGDGAFYGPKIDLSLKDSLGRIWQCGTIQLDFSMPERLGAKYISEEGVKKTPVMIHRAILGTLERFIGILIEHYAGHFPTWLAPWQVVVLNITDAQADYAEQVVETLVKRGIRAKSDLRNEKISFKIREHTLQHVPYLLIVGNKEKDSHTIAVRKRKGDDLGVLAIDEFCEILNTDVAQLGGSGN